MPTTSNPADCASCGLLPQDLLTHSLWWEGPPWLLVELSQWPPQPVTPPSIGMSEVKAVCHAVSLTSPDWIEDRYSSFTRLSRITAWIEILTNLRSHKKGIEYTISPFLLSSEINSAEIHLKFILSMHLSLLHTGPTLLLSTLGTTYHITGAKRLICTICQHCVTSSQNGRKSFLF